MGLVGSQGYLVPLAEDRFGVSAMHHLWREHHDPAVPMDLVVPGEKHAAPAQGVLLAAEAFGEARPALVGLEVALRKGAMNSLSALFLLLLK